MKQNQQVKYIEKTFEIFIRTICLKEQLQMKFYSNNSAKQHSFEGQIILNINKTFKVNTIDIFYESGSQIDKDVALNLYIRQLNFQGLVFDINIQKIAKQSKTIYRKQLKNKKGFIDYKFVAFKTKIISQSAFWDQNGKKEKIYLQQFNDYQKINEQSKKKSQVIKQKDAIISHLDLRIHQANEQIAILSKKLDKQLMKIKQGMNIKVKVGSNYPVINHKDQIKQEYQALLKNKDEQIKSLELKITQMELRMKLIQDLNGFGSKDQEQQDFNELKKSGLSRKMQKNNFFQSLDSSDDDSDSMPNFQNNLLQAKQKSFIEQSYIGNDFPSSPNILQIPTAFNNQEVKALENKKSVAKINAQSLKKSQIYKSKHFQSLPLKLKQSQRLQSIQSEPQPGKKSKASQIIVATNNNSNIQILKEKIESLQAQYEMEHQQKLFLKQQSYKKSKQIEKLLRKVAQGEKQKLDFQQQKGRLLDMFANKLCLGDKQENVKIIIKEMTAFNKNNEKQNANLIKENAKINKKLNSQMKKYQNLQLGYSQCVLKISHLNKEIQHYQQKCNKKMIDAQSQADFLSLKQQQECQMLKNQLILKQEQISKAKEQYILLKEQQKSLQEQITILQEQKTKNQFLNDQNEVLKLELNRMAIKSLRAQKIQQNYAILIQNYQSLLSSHDQIKLNLIKIENNYNKNVKHDDLALYQQQMDRVLIIMFKEVNKFQQQFYGVLLLTNKVALQSQNKYYQSFIKNQELYTKDWTQAQKFALLKEKESNIAKIKEKSTQFQQKISMKMKTLQEEISSFQEGVTMVQTKLSSLQKFRDQMYYFLKSLNIQVSQFISIKESTHLKSSNASKSKGKLSIQQMQILPQQQQNEEQENDRNKNEINNSTLRVLQPSRPQAKKSSLLQTSNKFELTKLRHSIAVKKSLLNEGVSFVASKVFSILKQSSQVNVNCHELIAAKRQMSLQRMKIRDRQLKNFQQSTQMVKKMDNSLFDEKLEKDRLILQYQKREKALEHSYQKMADSYQVKIAQFQTKIKEKQSQIFNLQQEKQKVAENINALRAVLSTLKSESLQGTEYILILQDQRDNLKEKIQKLQKNSQFFYFAEKQLIQQVQKVKEFSKLNDLTLRQLIEQRNHKFECIQMNQQKQIKQIAKTIKQLQKKLTQQGEQYLFNKTNMEYEIEQKNEHIEFLTNKTHDLQEAIYKLEQQNQKISNQNGELQRYNQEYQRNLCELAHLVQYKEKEILQMEVTVKAMEQERTYDIQIEEEIKRKQAQLKQKFHDTLRNSNEEVKLWQQQFSKLQFLQRKLIEQSHQRQLDKVSLQNDKKALNELVKKRQGQILKLQRQISEKQSNYRKIQLQIATVEYCFEQLKREKQQVDRLALYQKQKIEQLNNYKQSKRKIKRSFNITDNGKQINMFSPEQQTPIKKYGNLSFLQQSFRANPSKAHQSPHQNGSQSSFDSVQHRVQQLLKQNQQLLNSKHALQCQLNQKQHLIKDLITEIQQKDQQVNKLQNKSVKLQQKAREKQQNIQKLIAQLLVYQKQLNGQQRQIERLTKSLKIKKMCNLNEEIVHKQLIDLKSQNSQLKSLLSSLQTTVTYRSGQLKNTNKYLQIKSKNNIFSKKEAQKPKASNNQVSLVAIRDIDDFI